MKTCHKGHEREDSVVNCAICRRDRYLARRETEREGNRQWIADNRKRYEAKQKEYRDTNLEQRRAGYAEWSEKNPVHAIWRGMKHRCLSVRNSNYPNYGGRGITVCERWLGEDGYKNFETDMGPRPTPRHTLERVNNLGNYDPSNCVWALRTAQQRNRRTNRIITIKGATKCITEWAEKNGLCVKTLQKRVDKGWPESMWLIPADQRYRTIGRTGQRKS